MFLIVDDAAVALGFEAVMDFLFLLLKINAHTIETKVLTILVYLFKFLFSERLQNKIT
jgi:hypothetical protein